MSRLVRTVLLGVLVTLVCAAGAGASRPAPPAPCRTEAGEMNQALNGRVVGCLEIPDVRAGAYAVTISELPIQPAASRPKGVPGPPAPSEPAVRLTVSPSSGSPGTLVTITGHVSRTVRHEQRSLTVCWDGCPDGLPYQGPFVQWISARVFRVRIRVPEAPWVQGLPPHVALLRSGTYGIGVDCLILSSGCASRRTEGTARFTLHVAHEPPWCRTAATCARLSVAPGRRLPGQYANVTGYVPLVSIGGEGSPFGAGAQLLKGSARGRQITFPRRHDVIFADLGRAALRVLAPPSFASLSQPAPVSEVLDGLDPVGADPADPGTVVDCQAGSIGVTSNGITSSVSTAAATAELTQLGYESESGSPPSCAAVAPDGTGIAAAFPVAIPPNGGPPFYEVALATLNHGASWSALPTPSGTEPAGFGGFRYDGSDVEAVFAALVRSQHKAGMRPAGTPSFPNFDEASPLVERSDDGEVSWQSASACPASGPCLTLGPYGVGNCAMDVSSQDVLRGVDGDRRFVAPPLLQPLDACGEATLLRTAGGSELLINPLSSYPLTRSTDGGRAWEDIALPRAPGEYAGDLGPAPGGITVLPSGALLLSGRDGRRGGWKLLDPGARTWCSAAAPDPALQRDPQASELTVIGTDIWWQTATGAEGPDGPEPVLEDVPLSSVHC